VCRPDAASRDESSARNPHGLRAANAGAGTADKAHRRAAGKKTKYAREDDKPKIVILDNAGDNAKHTQPKHGVCKIVLNEDGKYFLKRCNRRARKTAFSRRVALV
jgi:hypothetical protein